MIGFLGSLWAATSDGLYRYPLAILPSATPEWRFMVLGVAIALGLVAVGVGELDSRRRRARSGLGAGTSR